MLAAAASSRTIRPAVAYVLIVGFAAAGPLFVGTAVARTVGAGIADFHVIGSAPLAAAITGALAAVGAAYAARVPTSLSVALFSSLIGALWAGPGLSAVHWSGIEKIALSMAASVIIGFTAGMLVYAVLVSILLRVHREVAERIVAGQFATVALLALGYGANDLEKPIGLFAAALPSATFSVPPWTIAAAVICFALGMALGGTRVAKTVGSGLFSIRPHHALAFQLASAATIIGAALLGGPLSTTEASASAIVGVGAAVNPRAVRWQVVGHIARSWLVTIPVALGAGAVAEIIVRTFWRQ